MKPITPRQTAIVVIDPQVWTFALPLAPRDANNLAGNIARLCHAFSSKGGVSIFTRAAFSAGYADMLKQEVDVPLNVPEGGIPEHALAFVPSLHDTPKLVITKRQWSAFYGTELDLQLRRRAIDTIVIAGVMTNFGVESTARDGWQHNYRVIVAEDACSSLDTSMHQFAMEKILPRVSRVMTVDAIVGSCV